MTIERIIIQTRGPGLYEFTDEAQDLLSAHGSGEGVMTVFVRHTSCSLLIQENADPSVRQDLQAFFRRLVPPSSDPTMDYIRHRDEGPDDMPAHIKAALLPVSLSIPHQGGRLLLGTWQGLYLFEHRDHPHRREILLHF
ncbi:secondary thiamine-phosphate synthase enzyme YjbQ [Rhizobium sp. AAP43]|uniref:secondary thiamine-phosphate synthase enzyme YjbQ n=1 Tax=Rhizobium sp. AAP43 TaxID=1523420 RepID=UPI0006B92A17|nr:secondary thiamine-phosphate synthase enzyme YjbQ [Rhizobium sp. AAP43]KPF45433.1 secondary thiamine-phosphate synthase [Rhizobium sp. AAP43]